MTSGQSLTGRDFPVHWPVHTRWTDNDMFGHLNNAVYYAAVRHRDQRMDQHQLRDRPAGCVVAWVWSPNRGASTWRS